MARGKKTGGRDWKSGESGNPNGRPPSGHAQSELLRKKSDDIDPDTGLSNREIITDKIIALAKDGVPWAIREWYDRTEGRAKQSMEVSGNINFPEVIGLYPIDEEASDTEDLATDSKP